MWECGESGVGEVGTLGALGEDCAFGGVEGDVAVVALDDDDFVRDDSEHASSSVVASRMSSGTSITILQLLEKLEENYQNKCGKSAHKEEKEYRETSECILCIRVRTCRLEKAISSFELSHLLLICAD